MFYTKLRMIRKLRGLTIKQVAELSGLSYRTVQSYELQDRTPAAIDNIIALSRALGVSVDYLLDNEVSTKESPTLSEFQEMFDQLNETEQETVLNLMKVLIQKKRS